jgi:hypothetical protein
LEWTTEKLSAEEVKELLLAEDKEKQTALHCAARKDEREAINKLWEWST